MSKNKIWSIFVNYLFSPANNDMTHMFFTLIDCSTTKASKANAINTKTCATFRARFGRQVSMAIYLLR